MRWIAPLVTLAALSVVASACTSDIGEIDYYGEESPNPSNSQSPGPSPTGSPPPTNPLVFVSSTTYVGADVNTTIGGDAKCDLRAVASGLPGSYTAWLSDSNADAIDRVADPGGWELFDGTAVFADLAAIASNGPTVAITLDEYGNDLGSVEVWTGTNPDGTSEGTDCASWNGGGQGHYGMSSATDTTWTSAGNGACNTARHLYCFRRP